MSVDDTALGVPELPEGFERTVWARLEPSLHRGHARMAVAAVLFASAAWLGGGGGGGCGRRLLSPAGCPASAGSSGTPAPARRRGSRDQNQVRERILLVDLGDHLDRSQRVLVELVSAEGAAADFAGERNRAEQLVSANRLYRETAAATGDASVVDLLDQLERVLVEVAASPSNPSAAEFGRRQAADRIGQPALQGAGGVFGSPGAA